jgi:hypothetical protein
MSSRYLLVTLLALVACRSGPVQRNVAVPDVFYVPPNATDIKPSENRGAREVTYRLQEPYPAATIVCDITKHAEERGWRWLRDDPLNPATKRSRFAWWNFLDATRKPENRVHSWSSWWTNEAGGMLMYTLRYEYPEGTKPNVSTLTGIAAMWPADAVRAQLGISAETMRAAAMTTTTGCASAQLSDFVRAAAGTEVVPAPAFELAGVESIRLMTETDGIGERIAQGLRPKLPWLPVATMDGPAMSVSTTELAFEVACHCAKRGEGFFYVTEAVLFTTGDDWVGDRSGPARIVFYWKRSGPPPSTKDDAAGNLVDSLAAALSRFRPNP